MKNYQNIFFDLDGTLSDSKEGITKSAQYALKNFGIEVGDLSELECFIGPPLGESFKNYYQFDDEKAEIAVEKHREYYCKQGINENKLYEGAKEILESLKKKNKRLIIATCKPTIFTEKILKNYNIYEYFDFISGATLDKTRNKKEDIIQFAIDELAITNREDCIMIGDTKYDMIGANINQIDSIGVLYGYGTKEELEKENATYIIDKISEILNIIA